MDNLGKALHIGVGVLLFIIALTSSVILYGRVMDYIDKGLHVSNSDRRAEETTDVSSSSFERPIDSSEIIMALVKIHSSNIDIIEVAGKEFSVVKTNGTRDKILEKLPTHQILVDGSIKSINEYEFHTEIASGVYTYSYSAVEAKDINDKDTVIKIMTYTKE